MAGSPLIFRFLDPWCSLNSGAQPPLQHVLLLHAELDVKQETQTSKHIFWHPSEDVTNLFKLLEIKC